MPLRILTNTTSLFAQQNLGVAQKSLYRTLERLSSGLRINHAYDDASGFLFSVQMQFRINGTEAGTNNLSMAIDLLNTADSYSRTIAEDLSRMQQLATQASNGLITADQRGGLNFEFQEMIQEIQRLAANATYNGRTLLDGTLVGVTTQTGFSVSDVVGISVYNLGVSGGGFGISGLSISTITWAQSSNVVLNSVLVNWLSPAVASMGAQAAGWMKSVDAQDSYATNLKAAKSRIWDADIAAETTNLTNSQVIVQSGIAALAQANTAQTMALGVLGGR